MALDPVTILVTQVLIILLVGLSYIVTWWETREEDALLWMAGASLGAGLGIVARFFLAEPLSLVLSNGLIGLGAVGLWNACRRLRGARAWPWMLPAPLLLWCALSLAPRFGEIGLRVVIANAIMGGFFLLAACEIWRLERGVGPLRRYLGVLLSFQTLVYAAWAIFNLIAPPGDRNLIALPGIITVDLVSLVDTLLIAIGLIVFARERAMRNWRRAATLDAVTGVANRRAFDQRLVDRMTEAERQGTSLALIMIDADHFKSYNDRYGHVQGDECLRRLARALDAVAVGQGGRAFRYGGEEFAVLIPGLDRTGAMALAADLRDSVRGLRIPHETEPGGIMTISMGVALAERGWSDPAGEGARALVTAADQALYQAKSTGRDRIIIVAGGQVLASQPSGAWARLVG